MKRLIRPIQSALRAVRGLALDRRGGVAMVLGVGVVPLVGFIGIATDTARGYMVKGKLQQALDSAALAGARVIAEPGRDEDIQDYFDANFPLDFMAADVDGPFIDASQESDGILVLQASATVPASFMRVLGHDTITVGARTVVRRATRGMELVLVMDNTGSMRSSGKIDTMKDAAQTLVNILYGERETVDDFWVGVVPYAATVNIGNGYTGWLQNYDAAFFQPTAWKGCVEARQEPFDQTDDTPAAEAFDPFLWNSTMGLYLDGGGNPIGDNDWDAGHIDEANGAQNNGLGPNLGCGPAITPLVAEKSTVQAAIAEMQPWHRGGTMANLGLAWGWRVLSPAWRGLWTGVPLDMPKDYDEPLLDKAVIILTDGVNQWYDWPGGLPDQPADADYTSYGRLGEARLGTTNKNTARDRINDRMQNVCDAMKAQGILIFTITFRLNNEDTKDLYRACATQLSYYFDSPSNGDLEGAFEAIGEELTNLRLAE